MIKALLLIALANTPTSGPVSRGDLLKDRQYEAKTALALYVDPTGSDSGACTSTGTSACLTIQGALNKIPKLLKASVTVTVAAGSYAGAAITGFRCDAAANASTAASIIVQGTLSNVTLATGTATGTATAGTAGSLGTPPSFGTLTDGTQAWTANDLRGHFVVITGGTGSGQVKPIISNTATALTIAGTWTAPTVSSTYAIQDSASIITSTKTLPDPGTVAAAVVAAGMTISDNVCAAASGAITVQQMKFTVPTTSRALQVIQDTTLAVVLRRNQFVAGGNVLGMVTINNAAGTAAENIYTGSGTSRGLNLLRAVGFNVTTSFFNAGARGLYGVGSGTASGSYFLGQSVAAIEFSSVASSDAPVVTGNIIDCNSAGGIGVSSFLGATSSATSGVTNIAASILSTSIDNCSTGVAAARRAIFQATGVTGATNTVGWAANLGGEIQIDTNSTLTGTTEISIDGTGTTLAAMRALTPKVITGVQYGSTVYE